MDRAEKLLRELIALPSVNPALLPPGDSRAGEERMAQYLAAVAAAAGLEVEFQEVLPHRCNVLARLRPPGKARACVVLAPHTDTVGHASMSPTLFEPRRRGERLYGRGACDTKGSVAAMLTALLATAASSGRPQRTEIVFAGLVDEEVNQTGSRALVRSGFRADLAIVGEPTRLQVITAHKGDLWLTLETRGKAAHGAMPSLGRNAVHEMARVVSLLEGQYAARLKRIRHPLLGSPTINVGSIHGGTQPNIVPDHCEISVDRRTIPGETDAGVLRGLKALFKDKGLRARIQDNKAASRCWPMETDPELPLVKQLLDIVGQNGASGVHYFSDASVLARGGTPAVLFGPGDIAQAHTIDEWISVRSLERATAFLIRFLQSLP